MEGLRWILLLLGILLVAGIYFADRLKRQHARRGSDHADDDEAAADLNISPHAGDDSNDYRDAIADLNHLLNENRDATTGRMDDAMTAEADAGQTAEGAAAAGQAEERLIIFYLKAPAGQAFAGPGLFEALHTAGLSLGTMGIYHDTNSQGQTVFSVANIFEPGTLETDDPDSFTTRGVALFMQLPGPVDERDAFERMLGKAEILAERLGGELHDEQHQPLDDAAVARLRGFLR